MIRNEAVMLCQLVTETTPLPAASTDTTKRLSIAISSEADDVDTA